MTAHKADETNPLLIDIPMPIRPPRLTLRPVQEGDGAELAKAVEETYELLRPYMTWIGPSKEEETDSQKKEALVRDKYAAFLKREDMMLVGIENKTGKHVVYTGLNTINWRIRRFNIGYWVRKSAQGNGYAAEGTNAILRYAFNELGARIVNIRHAEGNEASRKIIEKLGFTVRGYNPYADIDRDGNILNETEYYRTNLDGLPPLDVSWG